ncbi:MAG: zinc-dependent metalloprotease family protein [Candidatus Gracilibacteria bacterium]|nr:zinc-dependent metalloprotease family protein [Candidatus Gracilibacteria bacterium]
MKLLKYVFIIFNLIFSSAYAVETLRVAVVFDLNTTSYSLATRDTMSNKLISDLNKSFSNSGLSSRINFTRVYYDAVAFTNYNETIYQLKDRYNANRTYGKVPILNLHYIQKQNTADIVIGIVNPRYSSFDGICGMALNIPINMSQVKQADSGILFIENKAVCLDDEKVVSHEVGHTFGLQHGKAVYNYSGNLADYDINNILSSLAGGYGKTYWSGNYTTIMAKSGLNVTDDDAHKHNRFSDVAKSVCGVTGNQPCGDSNSSAVNVMDYYAPYYNMRGAWYN